MQVRDVTDHSMVNLVQASLHTGEAEVIVLATELHAEWLVMDDQDARRFANRCGLKTVGTLGILLAAKQDGKILSLQSEIERLVVLGFRINSRLVTAVLQRAGES
jgi:hypothetical protein